jgi:hypothetical protein
MRAPTRATTTPSRRSGTPGAGRAWSRARLLGPAPMGAGAHDSQAVLANGVLARGTDEELGPGESGHLNHIARRRASRPRAGTLAALKKTRPLRCSGTLLRAQSRGSA